MRRLRSLGLEGMALADVRVLVGPVSLPGPRGETAGWAVGADFFSSFEVDLDVAHGRLSLYERPPCAIAGPPCNLPYTTIAVNRSLHDHPSFLVSLDGHWLAAFIDTGAELSAFDAAAARSLGIDGVALDKDPVATLRGAGSEVVKSRARRSARLEIGGE